MTPRATYRLQFHKGFPFSAGAELAPYLGALGISHLYASPILKARSGSLHGYDVVDHACVNPELGGEEGFRALAAALRREHIGIIVDIVPNHMAVGGADNSWWLDVLEKGLASPHARAFDIDWEVPDSEIRGKILLPFLGTDLRNALETGALALREDASGLFLAYGDHRFPLAAETRDHARRGLGIETLLERQHYRLAHWSEAGRRINWRRFFNINGLAALRIEDDHVFESVHATIFRLYGEGLIDGVRIDHVDGLSDPEAYCRRLRERLSALAPHDPYIVVEKILAPDEDIPAEWAVDGTTGYDFMNEVSALQHEPAAEEAFNALWNALSGRALTFEEEERSARQEILRSDFASQLDAAARAFASIGDSKLTEADIAACLEKIVVHIRAYRSYADGLGRPLGEALEKAIARAAESGSTGACAHIAEIMKGRYPSPAAWNAARKLNQLTAPVAAKAVEDTAFYRYGRLLSRNDVGFAASQFSISTENFHGRTVRRGRAFPFALLATATHDHKRGEDVRARLAALSEFFPEWRGEVESWFSLNAAIRPQGLSKGDEYMLYQTLVGMWPTAMKPDDQEGLAALVERLLPWDLKALHEAKLRTSWTRPDTSFEEAVRLFVKTLLDGSGSRVFLESVASFVNRIAPAGALNGLVQATLRCTVPGVPDMFQGTELWDLSLVDPDNRRPVDYARRRKILERCADSLSLNSWEDGVPKLHLLGNLLDLRRKNPLLFERGDYSPLGADGARKDNILAFTRTYGDASFAVIVPLRVGRECSKKPIPNPEFWSDTSLALSGSGWRSAFGDAPVKNETVLCRDAFRAFPICVLRAGP